PGNMEHRFDGYFIKEYGIMQYYNEYTNTVYSSQFLFIRPAIVLDRLFTGNDAVFDVRFLAGVMLVYFLVVLYFLTDYLVHRLTLPGSLVIAAAAVVVFADTGYTAYFNSFYAEPIAYISLLGCITCALLYADGRYNRYALLGGFVLCGMILTFSKQQYAPVGVLLGLLGLLLLLKKHSRLFKWLTIFCSTLLAATGILTYLLISTDFTNINLYHAMTRGVLMTAENPPEALQEFGIADRYELLDGTIYFDKYPEIDPEGQLLHQDFYSRYDVMSIVKYYAGHPDTFASMLKLAAKTAYHNRPSMGNFERQTGQPANAWATTFSLYSTVKAGATPRTLGYIVLWAAVVLALLHKKRLKQIIVLAVILMGLSQIVVSIIGAGDADLSKHIFLYNAAYDLVNVLFLAHVVRFFDEKYQTRRLAGRDEPAQASQSV
ncbi:MAG: hypothetical protein PHO66_07360, partial [Eubacteriales bacterium]|nr:hypothetical protein [Eubacteriales bacterium]